MRSKEELKSIGNEIAICVKAVARCYPVSADPRKLAEVNNVCIDTFCAKAEEYDLDPWEYKKVEKYFGRCMLLAARRNIKNHEGKF